MKKELSLGIDVSKASVTCCCLDRYPGSLSRYYQILLKDEKANFPIFGSGKKAKQAKKKPKPRTPQEFREYLQSLTKEFNVTAILEPTGVHYSKLWAEILKSEEITILWIGHLELGRYRDGKDFKHKFDSADALCMAAHYWDPDRRTFGGEVDLSRYLLIQPDPVLEIRSIERLLNNLARTQSPIINYFRQRLSWQWPEKALSTWRDNSNGFIPPLIAYLGGRLDRISKHGLTSMEKAYNSSIARELGIEVSDDTRLYAKWLSEIFEQEQLLKSQLNDLMKLDEFEPYLRAFSRVFGYQNCSLIKARLLTRCYPFEAFLSNGKEFIEYEHREVKKVEKSRVKDENGRYQTVVKRHPGTIKRIKRNRSRDSFFARLGMGSRIKQSGDKEIEVNHGSKVCRNSLWQYVFDFVEKGDLNGECSQEILDHYEILSGLNTSPEAQKTIKDNNICMPGNGTHLQNKMMSKITHILYRELRKEFSC